MRRTLYVLVVGLIGLAVRSGRSKDLEIVVLRHQLAVLRREVDRPAIKDDDRTLLGAVAQALSRRARAGWIVTPDTLLRWHRRRVARHWTHPPRRRGRPATAAAIQQLVLEMAVDNPTWGYRRIHGELVGLGYRLAASTVWQILKDQGVSPAPKRASVTWSAFLHSQAAVACDFACIDTVGLRGYYLLFFIDVQTRRVIYAGITAHPTGDWTTKAARNLFLRHDQAVAGCKALVRDRGSQFTTAFDEIFRTEGIKILKTPVRTPVANAFAERWIGTLRR
jgi:transposase InsO family protein